jgi:hypothetical protein
MSYRIAVLALLILPVWLHVKADNTIKSTAAVKAAAKPASECGEWKVASQKPSL